MFTHFPEIVVPGYGEVNSGYLRDAVSEAQFRLDKGTDIYWLYNAYAADLSEIARAGTWRSPEAASLVIRIERKMLEVVARKTLELKRERLRSSMD